MTNTKQPLFKQLDDFIADLGCAEMRIDELLRELNDTDSSDICDEAKQITAELTSSINKFNANIKKIKQLN